MRISVPEPAERQCLARSDFAPCLAGSAFLFKKRSAKGAFHAALGQ